MTPSLDTWKSEVQDIKSRCGFCGMDFDKWQDRGDHLAKEFRNGATMKEWKGCRGLDPHVASQVTNSMPPYLIANESKSPFPFSATNSSSMKHPNLYLRQGDLEYILPTEDLTRPMPGVYISRNMDNSISPSTVPENTPQTGRTTSTESPNTDANPYATCWEILTLRLGRFARQHMEQHGPDTVTDEMLQREARHILYDDDDPWNQTAADNPEWLNLFKKAHGIDTSLPDPGVIRQHEILEDLGVGPAARLDQSFNLNHFECVRNNERDPIMRALAYECSLSGSMEMRKASGRTSIPSSVPGLTSSVTTSGASNLPTTSDVDVLGLNTLALDSAPGGISIGENGELVMATSNKTSTQNLARTQALDALMTPIMETSCAAPGDFDFPCWDQYGVGFDLPSTSGSLSTNVPASMEMCLGGADATQGGEGEGMRWDDGELGFGFDMDMDMDMGADFLNQQAQS